MPVEATRPSQDVSDYHTGRGGLGNEHMAEADDKKKGPVAAATPEAEAVPIGLADKLKGKIFGVFKK